MPRYRADDNQPEIVRILRGIGAFVFDASQIGGGFPDLLVAFRGMVYLLEVKNPATAYGKQGLSKSQSRFLERLEGFPIIPVWTADDALRAIGAI